MKIRFVGSGVELEKEGPYWTAARVMYSESQVSDMLVAGILEKVVGQEEFVDAFEELLGPSGIYQETGWDLREFASCHPNLASEIYAVIQEAKK